MSFADEQLTLVHVENRLVLFPVVRPWFVRCRAPIASGDRCPTLLFNEHDGGNIWIRCEIPGRGCVEAFSPSAPEPMVLLQICEDHQNYSNAPPNGPYPVEWIPFDPKQHRPLIRNWLSGFVWTPAGLEDPVRSNSSPAQRRNTRRQGPMHTPDPRPVDLTSRSNPHARPAAKSAWSPDALSTALYRYYDADDVLVYIGVTGDLEARSGRHEVKSTWSQFAARSTLEHFPNRPAALAAEAAAIRAERPVFNRQHNDAPDTQPRLVQYLIDKGRLDLLTPMISRG